MQRKNAGYKIIAICDLPDYDGITERQIVIGESTSSADIKRFCTWEYSKQGQYYFGHYNLSYREAYESMIKRASENLGLKNAV